MEKKFDYQALMFGFNVFQFICTGLVAWYVRRVAKQKATEKRFQELEANIEKLATTKDLDSLEKKTVEKLAALKDEITSGCLAHHARTTKVESETSSLRIELARLPTQRQIEALNASISKLNGELQKTAGRMEGVNRAVDLMNEHLINQGGKGIDI